MASIAVMDLADISSYVYSIFHFCCFIELIFVSLSMPGKTRLPSFSSDCFAALAPLYMVPGVQ